VSKSTAIAVLNIAQFGEFVANTPPADVMTAIQAIYRLFEKRIIDFPGMQTIKTAGDVCIVAKGFLNPDGKIDSADHLVHFALGCHELLEQVNITISAALTLRVGATIGGNLFLALEGTQFTAMGDPLATALLLESRALERTVNVSDAMYEYVSRLNYEIEIHETIEVPGGSQEQTYSVFAGKPIAASASRRQTSFGVSTSDSTHMSMFQVPSLVQLMNQNDGAEADAYAALSLDFLMNPP
jgi:class 3 adenylate cyclase